MKPAQVPKTGKPSEIIFFNGLSKSYLSRSFPIVVDSPPGIIRPSIFFKSSFFFTCTPLTPGILFKIFICSINEPCKDRTPTCISFLLFEVYLLQIEFLYLYHALALQGLLIFQKESLDHQNK